MWLLGMLDVSSVSLLSFRILIEVYARSTRIIELSLIQKWYDPNSSVVNEKGQREDVRN